MKKIKFLIAGLFSAIALVFACVVGTRVNAATIEFGTVSVSTASYTGDTKTWGFTTNLPGSNTNIAVGSDINGIVSAKDGVNGTKAAVIQIKNSASNGYDTYPGAEFLVPVPSADSTGTVTRTGNASGERFLALGSNNPVALASPMTFNFTSADIETNPTLSNNSNVSGYFLRFIVSGGEAKTYGISVQLKDGTSTYGAADIKYTVTYMDGTTTLKTDNDAVEGSGISYTPKKYGYDFEGWYTEAGLSNKIDTKTYEVTSDVTLYAKWTAWSNTSIGEYTLTNNAIEKIATGIDGNLAANLELAPSNYTALSGVGMTTTNVTLPDETTGQLACFNTNGAVSTTQRGIKFVAPSNGTITAWIGSGGGSQRNIKLSTDGENSIAPKEGSLIVGNLESNRYVPHEVVFEVEEGTTYYLGGDNGVRIYYISFEKEATLSDNTTAAVFAEKNTAGDTLRFVGTLTGITALANIDKIELFLEKDDVAAANPIELTTCYTSVINTSQTCGEIDNTYYVIFRLTGIDKLAAGTKISKQLKVTFTDGSSTISEVTEITL